LLKENIMDWKELGTAVAKIGLPLLGAVLPIPGGAAIGTALASAIGSGSSKPEDILASLSANAEALQKAKEFELTHQETMLKLQLDYEIEQRKADSADVAAVNTTMQTEATSSANENWFQKGWRPFNGYVVGLASFVVVIGVLYLSYMAVFGKDPGALNAIPTIVSSIAMVLAIPGAAVGITAWHRGMLQREEASSTDTTVSGK
jgi:type IV secretory pathway VirB2 component (pilin)